MKLERKNRLKVAVCWAVPWKPVERQVIDDEDGHPLPITFTRLHPNEMLLAARAGHVTIPESELPARRVAHV